MSQKRRERRRRAYAEGLGIKESYWELDYMQTDSAAKGLPELPIVRGIEVREKNSINCTSPGAI